MPVILALWRLRQEDQELKTSKGYLRLSKNGNSLEMVQRGKAPDARPESTVERTTSCELSGPLQTLHGMHALHMCTQNT